MSKEQNRKNDIEEFSSTILITKIKQDMSYAIEHLKKELLGLRTSRASVNFLDNLVVDAYGSKMPISQVATITTPDASTISIQVWDKNMVKPIEKSITEANLGVMPRSTQQIIHITMPTLTENRRKELVKISHTYQEKSKVSIRNIRRNAIEIIKKQLKSKSISEDDHYNLTQEIQKVTDTFIVNIDNIIIKKEKDIMQI